MQTEIAGAENIFNLVAEDARDIMQEIDAARERRAAAEARERLEKMQLELF